MPEDQSAVQRAAGMNARDASAPIRPTVAAFVEPALRGLLTLGDVTLGADAAHHAHVRRLSEGDPLTVRDGAGVVGYGSLRRLAKQTLEAQLDWVDHVAPPPPVHLFAPAGDRDRMLWLAEKATEIGVTSWRAVRWQRSRSVSPRGEGDAFVAKLRARMQQALAQSEGAWLPTVTDAGEPDAVLDAVPSGTRWVLDGSGRDVDPDQPWAAAGVTIALGPEGGLEPAELEVCERAGFVRVRLPGHVLRFETAGTLGVAFARWTVERARARAHAEPGRGLQGA